MFLKYFKNILIAIDQLLNTLAGGDPDWTISSRLGRNYKGSWMAKFIDFLFKWQGHKSHVQNASDWEKDDGKEAVIALNKKDNNIG